jgi:hypothetical protein
MQRFVIRKPLERAYSRRALFALELLDGVTLARVSDGVTVVADGLSTRAVVNASGLFVWCGGDLAALRKISIDPGTLPFEACQVDRAAIRLPNEVTPIELSPRIDYAVPSGITGLRGTLVEDRAAPLVPVPNVEIRLTWLDEDGITWHDAPTRSRTNASGDFVAILRVAAAEVPQVDASGAVTVRLHARRDAANERSSINVKLMQGRVADPTTLDTKTFAWDELQP